MVVPVVDQLAGRGVPAVAERAVGAGQQAGLAAAAPAVEPGDVLVVGPADPGERGDVVVLLPGDAGVPAGPARGAAQGALADQAAVVDGRAVVAAGDPRAAV